MLNVYVLARPLPCACSTKKRDTARLQVKDNKNTCLIQLVSDHTYNAYVGGQAQTVAKMENVLQQVTGLYNQTDFFVTDRGIRINVAPAGFQGACSLLVSVPLSRVRCLAVGGIRWSGFCAV